MHDYEKQHCSLYTMVGLRKLVFAFKAKNLKLGRKGRALILLLGPVLCMIIYLTYVLNSSSDSGTSKYDELQDAIIQGNGYENVMPRTEENSALESNSISWHLGISHVDQNSSQIPAIAITDLEDLATSYDDGYVDQSNRLHAPKSVTTYPQKLQTQVRDSSKNIPAVVNITPEIVTAKDLVRETRRFDEITSSLLQSNNYSEDFANVGVARDDKKQEHAGNKHSLLGLGNDTVHRIEENLISWKRREDARLLEERKVLEEGKQKLLEEKLRFQQEMSRVLQEIRRGDIRHKFVSRPFRPVDPSHWEGLNNSIVDHKYPGLVFLEDYRLGRPFVAPNDSSAAGMQGQPQNLDEMLDSQAEERFFQLISEIHLDCAVIRRMGSMADGGWDVCTVPPYILEPGCIVYSFGINYDFTFDDAMAASFDCTVKAFDPSMSVGDHVRSARVQFYQLGLGARNTVTTNGWKLKTFRHIRKKLGHEKNVIDILKIDIEYYEWECLRSMLNDKSLDNVKQLMFEMHTPEVSMVQRPSTKEDFSNMYGLLADLERAGFRRYNVHMNPLGQYTSSRTGKTRSCCFELYYVNIRFLAVK